MSSKKSFKKEVFIILTVMAVIGGVIALSKSSTHDHGDGQAHSHP